MNVQKNVLGKIINLKGCILNKMKYILGDTRLIILSDQNEVLAFNVIYLDNRKWIEPEGIKLDTGEEVVARRKIISVRNDLTIF